MWCMRLNLPMICSDPEAAEEDGDAPDRRGACELGGEDAMLAAPAE
jgi:hypothetical protein